MSSIVLKGVNQTFGMPFQGTSAVKTTAIILTCMAIRRKEYDMTKRDEGACIMLAVNIDQQKCPICGEPLVLIKRKTAKGYYYQLKCIQDYDVAFVLSVKIDQVQKDRWRRI